MPDSPIGRLRQVYSKRSAQLVNIKERVFKEQAICLNHDLYRLIANYQQKLQRDEYQRVL